MNAVGPRMGLAPRAEERRGFAQDLRLLALLHDREPTRELIELLRGTKPEDLFELPLTDARGLVVLDFLATALDEDLTSTTAEGLDQLAADHAAIYLNHTHRVSPSESPWIDPEGLFSQAPMFAVRDWYQHWGLEVPDWRKRPDDHLVVQLGFLAHLMEAVDRPPALIDAARFLDRHLLRWIDAFAEGVAGRCWMAFHAATAELTSVYLHTLRTRLAVIPGCEPGVIEPIESERRRIEEERARETCATPPHVPGVDASW